MRRHLWLIPFAGLLAVMPLFVVGPSNGKDYYFHLSSWLGAADQMRHGMLWPRWDFLAAYNAGEPRFVFYPPLSWMTGALLTFLLQIGAVPFAMAWICMTMAGFAMHGLAARYASPAGAMVAACVYLANPFMLFTILARCAYGELFAAAFCPWLLAAALEENPKAHRIALPLGLIWLSNVPGAVLCTYLLAFVAVYRLIAQKRWDIVRASTLGLGFAVALDAVSFLPTLHQRKYIDVDGAFPEGFRPVDNLAFFRALPSDPFFLQCEHLALLLLVVSVVLLLVRKTPLRPLLLTLTAAFAFSLTFLAKPFWAHLPALWVVQFPWREVFLIATVAALAGGLAWDRLRINAVAATALALALAAGLSAWETQAFHIPCTPEFMPAALRAKMVEQRRPGVPTYEYFVDAGDSQILRPDNPPFWLARDPAEYAPGTTPAVPDGDMPVVPAGAKLMATPMHFTVATPAPTYLAINLQDYPNWRITANGDAMQHSTRPDGLTVLALPAGTWQLDIQWHHTWDEVLGVLVSVVAWMLLGWMWRRPPPPHTLSLKVFMDRGLSLGWQRPKVS